MKYALSPTGERIEATKAVAGTCDGCGETLIAKCGAIKVHHWSHKAGGDCDPWWEPEGSWHRSWKALVRPTAQEVTMRDDHNHHRADIVGDRGRVVELQHSPISPETIKAREDFYGRRGRMVWLFDVTHKLGNIEKVSATCIWWKHMPQSLRFVKAHLYLDCGDMGIFHVSSVGEDNRLYGVWITKVTFLAKRLRTVLTAPTEATQLYCSWILEALGRRPAIHLKNKDKRLAPLLAILNAIEKRKTASKARAAQRERKAIEAASQRERKAIEAEWKVLKDRPIDELAKLATLVANKTPPKDLGAYAIKALKGDLPSDMQGGKTRISETLRLFRDMLVTETTAWTPEQYNHVLNSIKAKARRKTPLTFLEASFLSLLRNVQAARSGTYRTASGQWENVSKEWRCDVCYSHKRRAVWGFDGDISVICRRSLSYVDCYHHDYVDKIPVRREMVDKNRAMYFRHSNLVKKHSGDTILLWQLGFPDPKRKPVVVPSYYERELAERMRGRHPIDCECSDCLINGV